MKKQNRILNVGAYQFAVSGDIEQNLSEIRNAINNAAEKDIQLLIFPECALTGYPPHDLKTSADTDFEKVQSAIEEIVYLASKNGMFIVIGSITKEKHNYYNTAILFTPDKQRFSYHKRALWGWDEENFSSENIEENSLGVFDICGLKVGIRICFEVRFPEFFRELYQKQTDLNLILFYDVSDSDNIDRYELIRSHIRTRAVENITHTLSVNTISPYQTAPTALYDKSGEPLIELKRNKSGLLTFALSIAPPTFGEEGRIQISKKLTKINFNQTEL